MDISSSIDSLLKKTLWENARRVPLAGDASSRSYERLYAKDQQAILMIDPSIATVKQFLNVSDILKNYGYSAPKILAQEPESGLLLLEDFGDRLVADLLILGADEPELYKLAVDFLIDLKEQALPSGLPYFSPSYVLDQNSMFLDWYIPKHKGIQIEGNARTFYQLIWSELLKTMEDEPEIMLLRDFHAENILHLPERSGVKALGLLDYQDAMTGPAVYDLVSLLQDARRDVSVVTEKKMIDYYVEQTEIDKSGFLRSYAIMGAHRALRILGIFTRLSHRDGKSRYLALMPRVKDHLLKNLAHPDLVALKHWLEVTLGKEI